jgi:hypothetical protein
MQHRTVVHLELAVFHETNIVMVVSKAEKPHFHVRETHRRATVWVIERGKLQIEQLFIEVLGLGEVGNVYDVVLQLFATTRSLEIMTLLLSQQRSHRIRTYGLHGHGIEKGRHRSTSGQI